MNILGKLVAEVAPERLSAILRSDDNGPDALYPARIGVFCDDCGTIEEQDFLVNDRMPKPDRLELIRQYVRSRGWACDSTADRCPSCRKPGEEIL